MEEGLIGGKDIPLYLIEVSGLRGKSGLTRLAAPVKLIRALWQALAVVRRVRPDCVLGMGGFAAGPGGLAAWLLRAWYVLAMLVLAQFGLALELLASDNLWDYLLDVWLVFWAAGWLLRDAWQHRPGVQASE